jgi:hypothetical protein
MHKTLKDETTKPAAGDMSAQQRRFNAWGSEFNLIRPHEGACPEFCVRGIA